MLYEKEILMVLAEAGDRGLSIRKITRHVYNASRTLFGGDEYAAIHKSVKSFLHHNSNGKSSLCERIGKHGVYRLNPDYEQYKQLMIDFDCKENDEGESKEEPSEDFSLSLPYFI